MSSGRASAGPTHELSKKANISRVRIGDENNGLLDARIAAAKIGKRCSKAHPENTREVEANGVPISRIEAYKERHIQPIQDEHLAGPNKAVIDLSDEMLCKVCFAENFDTFLYPCGHLLCSKCAFNVTTCPVDRGVITMKLHAYV